MSLLFFVVLTILGAYSVTVALALGLLFFARATAPTLLGRNGEARPLFLGLNILVWSASAAVGGMLIGIFAQWHPLIVAFGLSCVLFAAIFSVALESIGKTSLNYEAFVGVCASASVIGGSLLMQFLHLRIVL